MPNQTANQPRPPVSAKMRKRKRQRAEQAGRLAEWKIRWVLWCKGYRLIHRRWRCVAGEIDLILRRRNLLVFAEVKYRQHGITDRIITPHQQQRISKAAAFFLAKNQRFTTFDCRFDFIAIEPGSRFGFGRIPHIHNAW